MVSNFQCYAIQNWSFDFLLFQIVLNARREYAARMYIDDIWLREGKCNDYEIPPDLGT